jgi:hypothetical protein
MTLSQWRAFDRFSLIYNKPAKKPVKIEVDSDLLFALVWIYLISGFLLAAFLGLYCKV